MENISFSIVNRDIYNYALIKNFLGENEEINIKFTELDIIQLSHLQKLIFQKETEKKINIESDFTSKLDQMLQIYFIVRSLSQELSENQKQSLSNILQQYQSQNQLCLTLKQILSISLNQNNQRQNQFKQIEEGMSEQNDHPYFLLLSYHMQIKKENLEEIIQKIQKIEIKQNDFPSLLEQIFMNTKISAIYRQLGKFKEAIKVYEANQQHLQNLTKFNQMVVQYFQVVNKANCAHIMQDQRILDKAKIYNEVALTMLYKLQKLVGDKNTEKNQLFVSKDCKMLESQILNNQSSILIDQNKLDQALERAFKALEINQKVFSSQINTEIATNLMNISAIYQQMEHFDEAITFAKRAQDIFEKLSKISENKQIKKQLAICLANIGFLFQVKEKLFESLLYNKKALDMMIQVEEKSLEIAGIYFNMSTLSQTQGDMKKAVEFAQLSLLMYEDLLGQDQSHPTMLDIYDHLGELNYQQQNFEKAIELYENSYQYRKNQEPNEQLLLCVTNLAHLYGEINDEQNNIMYTQEIKKIESRLGSIEKEQQEQ